MFYAIAIPIRLLMEENFLDQLNIVLVVEIIIIEFLFLFFGIKLLRKKRVKKKRVPERKFYGETMEVILIAKMRIRILIQVTIATP